MFTVNASNAGAAVHLTEGVVDVQPTLGGTGVTLTPGRTALITAVPGADVIVTGQDAGKRSNVTPSKSNGAGAHGGKGVTISTMAKSNSGAGVRHPRAVAIFASNNRGGLFAKGVNVKNAFANNQGGDGSATHGSEVSAVARDLVTYGGADVSATAKDGGLSSSGSGGGGLSSSGSGGGGLSSSGSGGGGLSSSGSGNNNAGGLGGGNGPGNKGKAKGGGKKS